MRFTSTIVTIIISSVLLLPHKYVQLSNVCIVRLSQEQEAQRQERVRAEEEEILRQVLELSLKEK